MAEKWSRAFRKTAFADALRRVPLVGPLVDCTFEDHSETIQQVCITLLLSTAPFTLGSLILYATNWHTCLTLPNAFWSTVWDGELFMCSTSLLAPIFWMALKDPAGAQSFPSKLSHMFAVGLIILPASAFFALGLANNRLKEPFTFHLSVWLFWASVVLLYLSTAFHSSRLPNAPEAFRVEEADFTASYRRHRR